MQMGIAMNDASYTEITEAGLVQKLSTAKIWPIGTGEKESGCDCLMSAQDSWYIADRKHLRDAFMGKLPFLALDRSALNYAFPFLDSLGLKRRLLSKNASFTPTVSGDITLLPSYTSVFRRKARYIAR
jgi:hypothetical protein